MQHRMKKEGLSVIEAVDNLTQMTEMDWHISEEKDADQSEKISWDQPESYLVSREQIKETFRVILSYLKHLHEKEKAQLRDLQTQRGMHAIMILVKEAAQKMDRHAELFRAEKEESITQIKEYQELQHFYHTYVAQKLHGNLQENVQWDAAWGSITAGDLQNQGLVDLETIRKDKEYELFFVRRADGRPFFHKDLLRHLRLIGEFDAALSKTAAGMEAPFSRMKAIQDHDLHVSAKEILHEVAPYVDDYYKEGLKHKGVEWVDSLGKALMALMLAANPRNLMYQTTGKSCLSYYADFHFYLRKAISSPEYQRYISSSTQSNRFSQVLLNLSHGLCTAFFTRVGGREEMIGLIRSLIEKGSSNAIAQLPTHSPVAFWNVLLDEDENIRHFLKHYPNGPLLRAVDLFEAKHQLIGFDPLAQENAPSQLYTIVGDQVHISCLRLACPIQQEYITQASPVQEFYGFLQALSTERKKQSHLLINLQDRTSWQEHARSLALEQIETQLATRSLTVVTIPKDGDFYWQSGPYAHLNDAREFTLQLKGQILGEGPSGFFFPSGWKKEAFDRFIDQAINQIHQVFFDGKKTLTHQNRLDFIEIFHLMIILRAIETDHPDSLSFTCKDAIDTGAAVSAELYSFLRMMNSSKSWDQEEKNFLLWMLYSPALTLRERAIDQSRFKRIVSALELVNGELEAKRQAVVEACGKLYELPFFKDLTVNF
jgi:hypothetical protein